ncbi:hypothetical protein CYY_004487 [Polysphondylium violaceum]|uniref:PH domain-containing protein n=1 Tax=Polysphondylium violaceum TaxID=133409 RepID=A0A8J4Q595_9MYCE|nr:hypothetical protein CYY_004487 [Polysphondylium violaceum]
MDCIITSGFLQKWSSRVLNDSERNILDRSCSGTHQSPMNGERVGALKSRWFILQSDFLNYYDKQPKTVLDYSCLKGQIYLKGCKLKHGGLITPIYQHWSIGVVPNTNKQTWKGIGDNVSIESLAISLVTPNGVEYTFTNPTSVQGDEAIKNLENWAYSISYAIFLSNKVKEEPIYGWLCKRGDKGHQFKNTKKRWCILQGSKLRYFSSVPKHNKISSLKGCIDLSHISEMADKVITEMTGKGGSTTLVGEENSNWSTNNDGCFGGDQQSIGSISPNTEAKTVVALSLSIYNEKTYVLIFPSQEERHRWVTAINSAVERSYTNSMETIKLVNSEKQVLVSGWMRKTKANKWWERRFCTLTSTNLVYYKDDPPLKPLGSIFLLVSSCRVIKQKSLDSLDWCFSIADSRGIEYFFNTETQDQMERWIKAIKVARKKLLLNLFEQNGKLIIPISLGKDCGLMTVQCKDVVRVNSLSNRIAFEINISNVKTATVLDNGVLEVVYVPVDGEVAEKRVEFLSQNSYGILQMFKDLFSCQENTIN